MVTNQPSNDPKTVFSAIDHFSKRIFFLIILLFLFCVIGLIILVSFYNVEDKSFGRTISDALLKIISGTVVGGAATLLVSYYSEKQLERKNQDSYKKDVLIRLQALYAKTKNVRRMLRAKGFTTEWYEKNDDSCLLKQSIYDAYINDINQSQLELEAIRKEIYIDRSIFSNPSMIINNLESMDKYLGKLISEYEKKLPGFKGEPAVLEIKDLPVLKKFLSKASIDGGFKESFSKKCKELTIIIRDDINFITSKKRLKVEKINKIEDDDEND